MAQGLLRAPENAVKYETTPARKLSFERKRWWYAAAGFGVGVAYTLVALLLGLQLRLGDLDLTLAGGVVVELSLAGFGWLWGVAAEAGRREKQANSKMQAKLKEIRTLEIRLLQNEKLASLGQLASTIAHEVRNPLAVIRSMVQNLAESRPSHGNHDEILEEIDRLARVTASLTGFARPLQPALQRVLPAEVLRRARLLATRVFDERSIDFEIREPKQALPPIEADPDLLCQVLLGLLENAAAASPRGGSVELTSHAKGGIVTFGVLDQGKGVPEEIRGRIFEPFFTTRPEGNGLGLAVAHQIVSAHHGWIEVGDAPHGGAHFIVSIPSTA